MERAQTGEREECCMPRLTDWTTSSPSFTAVPMPPIIEVRIDPKTAKRIMPTRRFGGVKLSETEVRKAVESHYPPVLTLDMAASISGYRRSTLKKLLSQGRFKNSAKRKKPVLFWRDRFIQELMQG
jgi:hypothetical protein